jgi:hypothetical protein
LNLRRFAGDEPVDIDIPVDHFDRLARQPDQTLDVVLRRVDGVLEDNDIPPVRVFELVDAFEHQNSVSVGHRDLLPGRHAVAATGATGLLRMATGPGGMVSSGIP